MSAVRRIAPLALLVAAALLSGCGEGDDRDQAAVPTDLELLERVSAAIAAEPVPDETIDYFALEGAYRQAGVELGESLELDGEAGPGAGELAELATLALPYLGRPEERIAEKRAIDKGRISALARTAVPFGAPAIVVLRTSQPFAAIEASLLEAGLKRSGGLLVSEGRMFVPSAYRAIADAGEGVVVLASSTELAKAALTGDGAALSGSAELVAELPGVARTGRFDESGCPDGVAGFQNLDPIEGELIVIEEGGPDPERLELGGGDATSGEAEISATPLPDAVVLGEPEVEGDRLSLPFSALAEPVMRPAIYHRALLGDPFGYGYDCAT